jgi:hypothetical protein
VGRKGEVKKFGITITWFSCQLLEVERKVEETKLLINEKFAKM